MIVPAPPPSYTLAPGLAPMGDGLRAALARCLDAYTGRIGGVIVTAAATTAEHHVLELATPVGTVLVLEPISLGSTGPGAAAAPER